MMNRKKQLFSFSLATLAGAGLLGIVGCAKEEPPVARKNTQAMPPPPRIEKTTSIEDLMLEMNIDERIHFADSKALKSESDRRAVLTFFDSFARGNPAQVREMLPIMDQVVLDDLLGSGAWENNVEDIEDIEIWAGNSPTGRLAVLVIFTVNSEFQPALWHLRTDVDGSTFNAIDTPPGILDRIYGDDMISMWHQILEDDRELADQPDVEWALQQTIIQQNSLGGGSPSQPDQPDSPAAPPSLPGSPGAPGGAPEVPG